MPGYGLCYSEYEAGVLTRTTWLSFLHWRMPFCTLSCHDLGLWLDAIQSSIHLMGLHELGRGQLHGLYLHPCMILTHDPCVPGCNTTSALYQVWGSAEIRYSELLVIFLSPSRRMENSNLKQATAASSPMLPNSSNAVIVTSLGGSWQASFQRSNATGKCRSLIHIDDVHCIIRLPLSEK